MQMFLYLEFLQPTEAIFIDWYKDIVPNSDRYIKSYVVETKIYSVNSLFEFYNNPNNSYYESRDRDILPRRVKHDYSRTGNYSFPGIFNHSVGTSFY